MRKRIVTVAILAAVLAVPSALALAATSEGDPPSGKVSRDPCPVEFRASAFRTFAEGVWDPSLWEREPKGKPKEATLRAMRKKRRCAAGPNHRREMRRFWKKEKRAFYRHRGKMIERREYEDAISPPGASILAEIRACESGGDYSTNTGNGFYGAYQFTLSTWESVGGYGYPHEASPREQDERAARLYRESGSSPWPVCGV